MFCSHMIPYCQARPQIQPQLKFKQIGARADTKFGVRPPTPPHPPKTFLHLKLNLNMVLINLAPRNFKYKPIMDGTYHPSCQKISSAVNSCQSAVKLDLQNLLNYITLPYTELHKTHQINIISTPTNHWCTVSPKMSTF